LRAVFYKATPVTSLGDLFQDQVVAVVERGDGAQAADINRVVTMRRGEKKIAKKELNPDQIRCRPSMQPLGVTPSSWRCVLPLPSAAWCYSVELALLSSIALRSTSIIEVCPCARA
jgi:hypothetical protein